MFKPKDIKNDFAKSFSGHFMKEEGRFMSGDPAHIANQQGWTGDNFGWYRDKNGSVVARAIGGKMVVYDGEQPGRQMQTDMGNPAITAGQKPAERARSMGLQSNGKGGYMDDSGQVVARTVNGELVFYDDKGGAVSDGAGGQALVQSQPSWVDPTSGLILVPPAQPETPEELAAVPDPIPAQPPMGYDLFVTQRHKQKHAEAAAQAEAEADLAAKQEEANQPYQGAMKPLKLKFDALIKKAEESGSKYKAALAAMVLDKVNENGQKYAEYYNAVPPEQHPQLDALVIKQALNEAKHEYYMENVKEKADRAGATGNKELRDKLRALNTSDHIFAQEEIDGMVDEGLGIKSAKKAKKSYGSSTKLVKIDVKERKIAVSLPDEYGGTLDDSDFMNTVISKAEEIGREYKIKDPKQFYEVSWDTKKDPEDMNENEKKRAALQTLQEWKEGVLPNLPAGIIVWNKPTSTQRGRIYERIGFSSPVEYPGLSTEIQIGMVVEDEDGNKKIVPVDLNQNSVNEDKHWKSIQIEESALNMDTHTMTPLEINIVYNILLE